MSSQTQPLSVAVVGGGIAGFTAALSLHKHGFKVVIFEQSRLAREIGAAFHLTPNACTIMSQLGIDLYEVGAVNYRAAILLDPKTGEVIHEMSKGQQYIDLPKGEDWVMTHRYHMHQRLKTEILKQGIRLETFKQATDIEPENLKINFQDGTSYTADIIIGADGVHSAVRGSLYPNIHAAPSRYAAFRFILKREEIERHGAEFGNRILQPGKVYRWGATGTTLLCYPMSNDTQMNFACIFPTNILDLDAKHDNQYSQKASKEQLLYVYRDFDPRVLELCKMADEDSLRYWPLMDMPDIPSYVHGNIAMIGDASHPFLPFAFQGAGLAIEDGAAVAALLAGVKSSDEVAGRLKLYEELRHARCAWEQQFSRDMYKDHAGDEDWDPTKVFENIYLYRVLDEVRKLKDQHGIA